MKSLLILSTLMLSFSSFATCKSMDVEMAKIINERVRALTKTSLSKMDLKVANIITLNTEYCAATIDKNTFCTGKEEQYKFLKTAILKYKRTIFSKLMSVSEFFRDVRETREICN